MNNNVKPIRKLGLKVGSQVQMDEMLNAWLKNNKIIMVAQLIFNFVSSFHLS